MDSRYRLNDEGSETKKTKETSKSSSEAAPKSEKRHAALAKIPSHDWLQKQVLDWAEDSDASLALTCPNDKWWFFRQGDQGFEDKYYGSYFVFYNNELTLHCLIERYFLKLF